MFPNLAPISARHHNAKEKGDGKSHLNFSQRRFQYEALVESDNLLLNLDRMYQQVRKSLEGGMKVHAEYAELKASPRQRPQGGTFKYFKRRGERKSPRSDPLLKTVGRNKCEVWVFKKTHKGVKALEDKELQRRLDLLEKRFL